MDLLSIDVADPDLHAEDRARAVFALLRREDPVHWNPEAHGRGFWAVTRYDDIVQVSRDTATFSSDARHGGIRLTTGDPLLAEPEVTRSMIQMDAPEHSFYRRMLAPGFTPARLRALEERIRARVHHLLDRALEARDCDWVSMVAAELPIQMLAELLDVPQEDRGRLFEWSNMVVGETDRDLRKDPEQFAEALDALRAYATELWAARTRRPGDDLVSMLAQSRVDGQPLDRASFLSAFILLIVAGNETTRNSISGGLLAFIDNPGEWQRLRGNPALAPRAVDEILRWVSPILHMHRNAITDDAIGGRTVRKGDKVAMWYVSANFDEARFTDPKRFDITREGEPHLSFGIGTHFCLGSRLGEMQLRILLEELAPRLARAELMAPVRRVRSNLLNSIRTMPVRLHAA
jgi:linalool 8-monooxygenase